MYSKKTNKGFTIVELVIVIAVIAILAAVLIPTFSSLVKKAETAADIQLVKNLNTIVAAEAVDNGGKMTPHDAVVAISENGYDLEHITPTADGRTIVWDAVNARYALLDEDLDEIYPKDKKSGTAISNLFVVANTYPSEKYAGYAVYLTEDCELTDISVTTGVDVGYNTEVVKVTYTGTDEVLIRTNSELCSFAMSQGTVNHYGIALNAIVSGGVYNCFATLMDGQYASADEIVTNFAGGLGTQERPYLIATSEHLKNIETLSDLMENQGIPQYIKLVADVETNATINTMFLGVFDGNGHSVTLDPQTWNWPGLFQGTMNGDATFKNFTYICKNEVTPIAYSGAYNYTGGTVTFENITAVSANPGEVLPSVYNSAGPFLFNTYEGNVVFKNCVNEINYSVSSNYNGIFISNYASRNYSIAEDGSIIYPTIVFENCINRGTVSGVNVGFFNGNTTVSAGVSFLVDSPDYVNVTAGKVAYYIKGCKNEGVIIGTQTASALSTLGSNPDVYASNVAINASLTADQFVKGMMFVARTNDMSLTNNNNVVTIDPSSDASVDSYWLKILMYSTTADGKGSGPQFIIEHEIAASAVSSTSFKFISAIIADWQYEEANSVSFSALAAQYGKKSTVQFDYVELDNGDGSVTLVVAPNTDFDRQYKFGASAPDYNLYALSDGALVGSVQYRHGENMD